MARRPRKMNCIQFEDSRNKSVLHILTNHSDFLNRENIRNFIQREHSVDVGQSNYHLCFIDNFGYIHHLPPEMTIRNAFNRARTILNGQSVVCLSLKCHQCGLKLSDLNLKREVKEENF